MADISKIKLPNGNSYNVKDSSARDSLSNKQDKGNYAVYDVAGSDLNLVTKAGMYWVNNGVKNNPSRDYGQLLVVHGAADTIAQIYFDYSDRATFIRTGNAVDNPNGAWTSWGRIVYTDDSRLSDSRKANGGTADSLKDVTDGTAVTANRGAAAMTVSPKYLAAWDDHQLKAISPSSVKVNDSSKVNGHHVYADVPSNAKFTDTILDVSISGNKLVFTKK